MSRVTEQIIRSFTLMTIGKYSNTIMNRAKNEAITNEKSVRVSSQKKVRIVK